MNTSENPPVSKTPPSEQQGGKQATTAMSQIISGLVSLLGIAGGVIVRVVAKCFRLIASRLDRFAAREFNSQGAADRALRASQKPATAISHVIKRWQLGELQSAPAFTRVVVICIFLFVGYRICSGLFSSAAPLNVVRAAVARDVSNVVLPDGRTWDEGGQFGLRDQLKSFKITNRYTRKINGERFIIYDYVAEVDGLYGSRRSQGSVHLVKRGSQWYSK